MFTDKVYDGINVFVHNPGTFPTYEISHMPTSFPLRYGQIAHIEISGLQYTSDMSGRKACIKSTAPYRQEDWSRRRVAGAIGTALGVPPHLVRLSSKREYHKRHIEKEPLLPDSQSARRPLHTNKRPQPPCESVNGLVWEMGAVTDISSDLFYTYHINDLAPRYKRQDERLTSYRRESTRSQVKKKPLQPYSQTATQPLHRNT
ncbi:unnamed protein product [Dibothriocephalus latus]|uniref:Uncharacterized protein n=1 Tax=Dibothriocephalus latus TaxID=60516 RepID=A0A3P7PZM6_DIBLA|nr:unnamed protein product [Dibothriocephalus latus]